MKLPKIGSKFTVPRPRKPFKITVTNVTSKSVIGKDSRGKKWRVAIAYLLSHGATNAKRSPQKPQKPQTKAQRESAARIKKYAKKPLRDMRGRLITESTRGTWGNWDGFAKPKASGSRKQQIVARVNQLLASPPIPRPKKHFIEGGDGYNGFLWVSIPGAGKFMPSTGPFEFSNSIEKEINRRIKAEFPDASVWINLD